MKKNKRVRLASISIDTVLPHIRKDNSDDFDEMKGNFRSTERKFKHDFFGGHLVKVSSLRLRAFKKSTVCEECGLKANHFSLERIGNNNPNLELYGRYNNKDVLFVKQLRTPLDDGGVYCVDNVRTICINCSNKKGE